MVRTPSSLNGTIKREALPFHKLKAPLRRRGMGEGVEVEENPMLEFLKLWVLAH